MQQTFRLSLIAAAIILMAPAAHAQLIDDVSVAAKGQYAVVNIRLNTQVQYLRHHPVGEGNLVRIDFQVVASRDFRPSTVEEFHKIPASDIAPGITVEYPPQGNQLVKRLTVSFTRPVKFKVLPGNGNRAFVILIPLPDKGAARKAPAVAGERYVLVLDSTPGNRVDQSRPIPAQLQDYSVFTTTVAREGKPETQLNLGYFASEAEARKAQAVVASSFPRAKVVRSGEPPVADATAAAPSPQEVPVFGSAEELEKHAAELLAKGRAALDRGENAPAIEILNRLLVLPPNRSSQQAQELVGLARERNGELAKAKAEYELYLKLFPEGEGAKRVKERLAALAQLPDLAAAERARGPAEEKAGEFSASGSLSQYYYRGATRAETTVVNATTVDKATFTGIDQSALVTNVDVTGRYRSGAWDNRLVFRDTHALSFLKNRDNVNRVNAAYYEFRNLPGNYAGRLGRQVGVSGGVYGRFDGALFGYALWPKLRLNAVAGQPVDPVLDTSRRFYGLSLDLDTISERWSGSVYAFNQTADGIVDRQAVGGELRYFDPRRSAYALIDYDTSFRALNIGMFQGTWTADNGLTWNMLLDKRKTPSLAATNALIGESHTSVRTLLDTLGKTQVRQQALDRTTEARLFYFGVSRPVTPTWQLGADFRLSNIGALPATTDSFGNPIPATPATGDVYSYNLQAIGSNLLSQRDITVLNGGYVTGPNYKGRTLSATNLYMAVDKWIFEPSLRLYWQTDLQNNKLRRVSPGLRLSYRWKERMSFEFEGVLEHTRIEGPTQNEDTLRKFFSAGYRYEF